jgi:hypothetical protein
MDPADVDVHPTDGNGQPLDAPAALSLMPKT